MFVPSLGETNSLSRTNITRARSRLLFAPPRASAAAIKRWINLNPLSSSTTPSPPAEYSSSTASVGGVELPLHPPLLLLSPLWAELSSPSSSSSSSIMDSISS
ncbi:hypothetical protein PanWU01x14_157270 [Parasponia andersonii]|uniref:Uncharacterized protein n=1 Tax=Parasponia andersonii TaxID=3476 RepID=A0A2P5CFL6_PARAD|nr:hypothetical protein PanWU01x14_157270 [Parasponia andersonii]